MPAATLRAHASWPNPNHSAPTTHHPHHAAAAVCATAQVAVAEAATQLQALQVVLLGVQGGVAATQPRALQVLPGEQGEQASRGEAWGEEACRGEGPRTRGEVGACREAGHRSQVVGAYPVAAPHTLHRKEGVEACHREVHRGTRAVASHRGQEGVACQASPAVALGA